MSPSPKFKRGDQVIGPATSRDLPLYEIQRVYGSEDHVYIYMVRHLTNLKASYAEEAELKPAETPYIDWGHDVYWTKTGEKVASSDKNPALIAQLLNKYCPKGIHAGEKDDSGQGSSS